MTAPDPQELAVAYYVTVVAGLVADDAEWSSGFEARLRARVASRAAAHDAFWRKLSERFGWAPATRAEIDGAAPWSADDADDARSTALRLGTFTRLVEERPISPARVVAAFTEGTRVELAGEAIERAVADYFLPALVGEEANVVSELVAALAALLPESSPVRPNVSRSLAG